MVRYSFDKMKVNKDNKIISNWGDGKKYELRIKTILVIIIPTSALLKPLGTGKKVSLKDVSVFQGKKTWFTKFSRIILKKFFNRE
jgi:hypothetical protein